MLSRRFAVAVAAAGFVAVALLAQSAKPGGARMADAAAKLLAALPADAKAKAAFPYDSPERTNWHFVPLQDKNRQPTRKGLRFDTMTDAQKALALDLLKTGLSKTGYEQATGIMGLETILADLEKNGANTRNPNWYFVSIFGDPTPAGTWGWRVEGHHLSVNVTLAGGEVVSTGPVVFATNPAEVKAGPKKGLRVLADVDDKFRELVAALDADQTKAARRPKAFPEIRATTATADLGDPVGVKLSELTPAQAAKFWALVEVYANRLPDESAAAELKLAKSADPAAVFFAYSLEEDKPGQPTTYRVYGPTFAVEYLNVQADSAGTPANHIHSGWRKLPRDFAAK